MDDHRSERLRTWHLWADVVSKILGVVALVVAAWWTSTNFTVERTHDPTMEVSDGRPRPILLKRNLLASNEDYRHNRYQLNPGVRTREPFACVVRRNRLYAIRARLWTEDGSVADLVYVDTFRLSGG